MSDPKDKPPVPVQGSAIMTGPLDKGAMLGDAFRNAFGDHPAMGVASAAAAMGTALDKMAPPVEPAYYLPTVYPRPEVIEIHHYHHYLAAEETPTDGDGSEHA